MQNKENISLTPIQKAASMSFLRRQRFVEGYEVEKELIILCNSFFGERGRIENSGLVKQFKAMKEEVIKNNLIGLVLCGINNWDTFINNYTTVSMSIVKLTIASITRALIYEYFSTEEIDKLCKMTPNFEIYYQNE